MQEVRLTIRKRAFPSEGRVRFNVAHLPALGIQDGGKVDLINEETKKSVTTSVKMTEPSLQHILQFISGIIPKRALNLQTVFSTIILFTTPKGWQYTIPTKVIGKALNFIIIFL